MISALARDRPALPFLVAQLPSGVRLLSSLLEEAAMLERERGDPLLSQWGASSGDATALRSRDSNDDDRAQPAGAASSSGSSSSRFDVDIVEAFAACCSAQNSAARTAVAAAVKTNALERVLELAFARQQDARLQAAAVDVLYWVSGCKATLVQEAAAHIRKTPDSLRVLSRFLTDDQARLDAGEAESSGGGSGGSSAFAGGSQGRPALTTAAKVREVLRACWHRASMPTLLPPAPAKQRSTSWSRLWAAPATASGEGGQQGMSLKEVAKAASVLSAFKSASSGGAPAALAGSGGAATAAAAAAAAMAPFGAPRGLSDPAPGAAAADGGGAAALWLNTARARDRQLVPSSRRASAPVDPTAADAAPRAAAEKWPAALSLAAAPASVKVDGRRSTGEWVPSWMSGREEEVAEALSGSFSPSAARVSMSLLSPTAAQRSFGQPPPALPSQGSSGGFAGREKPSWAGRVSAVLASAVASVSSPKRKSGAAAAKGGASGLQSAAGGIAPLFAGGGGGGCAADDGDSSRARPRRASVGSLVANFEKAQEAAAKAAASSSSSTSAAGGGGGGGALPQLQAARAAASVSADAAGFSGSLGGMLAPLSPAPPPEPARGQQQHPFVRGSGAPHHRLASDPGAASFRHRRTSSDGYGSDAPPGDDAPGVGHPLSPRPPAQQPEAEPFRRSPLRPSVGVLPGGGATRAGPAFLSPPGLLRTLDGEVVNAARNPPRRRISAPTSVWGVQRIVESEREGEEGADGGSPRASAAPLAPGRRSSFVQRVNQVVVRRASVPPPAGGGGEEADAPPSIPAEI